MEINEAGYSLSFTHTHTLLYVMNVFYDLPIE